MAPLRVVIYAAKSTVDTKGSIDQQIAECKAHADAKGWTVDRVEQDEAASAWSGSRGAGLERAMARAEELASEDGEAGFMVWKTNRLARGEFTNDVDAKHLTDYYRWANRQRVELHSVTDQSTFEHPVIAFVVGEMNAAESTAKSHAVKRATAAARVKGKHIGGKVYGYDRDPVLGLKPNAETGAVVKRIFALVAGGTSQAETARILNAESVPTPNGGKSGWVQGSISQILKRQTYLGLVPGDDPADRAHRNKPESYNEGLHEALIERDVWDAAQAAIAQKLKNPGNSGGRRSTAGHLLPGRMLHHATCGQAMTPRSGKVRKDGTMAGTYLCSGQKGGVCEGLVVPMAAVDDAITAYVAQVGIDADKTLALLGEAQASAKAAADSALTATKRELGKLEERHARLWDERLDGTFPADDWARFKGEHTERKAALEAQQAQLEANAAVEPAEVPAAVDALALVRQFAAGGDAAAFRNAIEALFSDFLIGEVDQLPNAGTEPPASRKDALEARARLVAKHPGLSSPDIAAKNEAAMREDAALSGPEAADDPTFDGIATGRLLLLPQPRSSVLSGLVDAQGRSIFHRLPLVAGSTTDKQGLAR